MFVRAFVKIFDQRLKQMSINHLLPGSYDCLLIFILTQNFGRFQAE